MAPFGTDEFFKRQPTELYYGHVYHEEQSMGQRTRGAEQRANFDCSTWARAHMNCRWDQINQASKQAGRQPDSAYIHPGMIRIEAELSWARPSEWRGRGSVLCHSTGMKDDEEWNHAKLCDGFYLSTINQKRPQGADYHKDDDAWASGGGAGGTPGMENCCHSREMGVPVAVNGGRGVNNYNCPGTKG